MFKVFKILSLVILLTPGLLFRTLSTVAVPYPESSEIFFIEEPLLFIAFCSHTIVSNVFIKTILSGNKKIEYNPEFIKSLSFEETKEYLKFELIRILLKHPYQRKKDHPVCSFLASQIVITQYFSFQNKFFDIQLIFENPFFDRFESFEFYYN